MRDSSLFFSPRYVSVAEMVAIEKAADANGLTYAMMMENAGMALASWVEEAYSQKTSRVCLGLVGKGNNGGDTLIALARLAALGWTVSAALVGRSGNDDPLVMRLRDAGGSVYEYPLGWQTVEQEVSRCGVLLDGLLGTGTRLPLRTPASEALGRVGEALNRAPGGPVVVAVDCPSGVDCDTGEAAEETITADQTVCMAAVKRGLLALPAFGFVGGLNVVGIGLSEGFEPLSQISRVVLMDREVRDLLPRRALDSHKGTFGRVVVVGGSRQYAGAPLLAGKAAFRSGAGWVTLAVPEPLQLPLAGHFPEATWIPLPHVEQSIAPQAAETLAANLERATALLVGPGLGRTSDSAGFLDALLSGSSLPPLVLDAEALRLLAEIRNWASRLPSGSILTPHPGEMANLTGMPVDAVQADRIGTAERFARERDCVLVLKGAFTLVAAPDGRTAINPVATAALARAGTGDVLAGIIAGLRGQGLGAFEAATAGVWLHGQAGLVAERRLGSSAAVLAGDLPDGLGEILAALQR